MPIRSGKSVKIRRLAIGEHVVIEESQPSMQRRLADMRRIEKWGRRFRVRSLTEYREPPVVVTRLA